MGIEPSLAKHNYGAVAKNQLLHDMLTESYVDFQQNNSRFSSEKDP